MLSRELIRKIRKIEIATKRLVSEQLGGRYHSAFKGRGMTFEEVRPYSPGDEIRTIDWNVTARMGEPFVKVFREERELTVMLVIDKSGSAAFGSAERTKNELIAEVAALIAYSAISNNDRVGAILFTDRVEKYVAPKKGRKHVLRLIRDLLHFEPEGKGTDVGAALEFLLRVSPRRTLAFLVSDFVAEGYERPLKVAARKHVLVAIRAVDPLEREFPRLSGLLWMEDLETGERFVLDAGAAAFGPSFKALGAQRAAGVQAMLKRMRIDEIEIATDREYVHELIGFFQRRARRRSAGR
ncbi:MAG: DUF58 domain-containing protein [Candidatus Methylomirabilis sp.]|nr:DUF58 domain-containing protein [Deltaproteobacteria bacterium]